MVQLDRRISFLETPSEMIPWKADRTDEHTRQNDFLIVPDFVILISFNFFRMASFFSPNSSIFTERSRGYNMNIPSILQSFGSRAPYP